METKSRKRLPNWMNEIDENVNIENDPSANNKRYRLRSSAPLIEKPETKCAVIRTLPFIEYKGKVEYFTEFQDIASCCDSLMQWVDKHENEIVPIAFDMEWPFSFQTGAGKSSVIQLCADVDVCYVLHLSKLKKLPAALLCLLYHPKVRLHGVNIKNDCRKLQRDFPETNSDKMIERCIDLGVWYNDVQGSSGRWSLERLVLRVCHLQINKDGKVRRSKWDIQPLSDAQQLYAAIDVYISQVIYYKIEQQERENKEKVDKFVQEYGEQALTALNQLK